MRYIIGLDLFRPHHNSASIAAQLRSLDRECQNLLSNLWLVNTNLPIHYIRARLLTHMSPNDKLYICDVGREAIGVNLECNLSDAPARRPDAGELTLQHPDFFTAGLLRSTLRRRSKLLVAATATVSAAPPRSVVRVANAENSRSA